MKYQIERDYYDYDGKLQTSIYGEYEARDDAEHAFREQYNDDAYIVEIDEKGNRKIVADGNAFGVSYRSETFFAIIELVKANRGYGCNKCVFFRNGQCQTTSDRTDLCTKHKSYYFQTIYTFDE